MFAAGGWLMSRAATFAALILVPAIARLSNSGGTLASGGFSVATETAQRVTLHDSSSSAEDQSDSVTAKRAKASKWDWEALTDIGNLHGLIDLEQKRMPRLKEETCAKMFAASKAGLSGLSHLQESGSPAIEQLASGCAAICNMAKNVQAKWGPGGTGPYAADIVKSFGCL
eukprot:gnl/MRDRNA2_/MRDRNA2_89069_c0_seq1.p1 gnl/MRDRNA2_/MRDRNA2_89069_c0~~gnl/MRDRNA2_/MRDRNA2_89069_c0_seq1.p1  ORF type:complete len:171 (+),score=32.23 gnl/MRDRNA2_/MRDRNA2_89069_c0_seq1:66-578(+)